MFVRVAFVGRWGWESLGEFEGNVAHVVGFVEDGFEVVGGDLEEGEGFEGGVGWGEGDLFAFEL